LKVRSFLAEDRQRDELRDKKILSEIDPMPTSTVDRSGAERFGWGEGNQGEVRVPSLTAESI